MTSMRDEFERQLGENLGDLIPLVTEALQHLDKPGTRALRRKLDKAMNSTVWGYGCVARTHTDECDWDALRATLPRYKRATDPWPAEKTVRAKMEARREAVAERSHLAAVPVDEARQQAPDAERPRPIGRPVLVVHDGGLLGRRRPARPSHKGDAA
jgi:hypothetical protein